MIKHKPTIKDIARAAKVSPTAVSMALNDRPRIGAKTRQRILQIAKALHYQPNFVARSLVKRQSHTLGVIITSIMNPFYPELAKGIEDKAAELGYNIILCSTNYNLKLEKDYIGMLQSNLEISMARCCVVCRRPGGEWPQPVPCTSRTSPRSWRGSAARGAATTIPGTSAGCR